MYVTKFLDKKDESLEQYLVRKEILDSRKFAYYANREDELSQKEWAEYSETFLCKCHLTMLKVTQLQIDKDDSEESEQDAMEGGTYVGTSLYLQISLEITEQIQNCCEKVPSFAGFWYENLFFKHHSLG